MIKLQKVHNKNTKFVCNLAILFFAVFANLTNFDILYCKILALALTQNTQQIYSLQFNTLMAFPERALHEKNHNNFSYDKTKITPKEFSAILQELYYNNFMLVRLSDIVNVTDNETKILDINLPENKKPLLLTFDNVTYKSSYQNLGEIDKIIIDRNNNIATYTTKKSIQERVQYDNEFVVILEDFISLHPDFSYNSARGIMFFTGENGILGYSTNPKNSSTPYERKRVLEVINRLKSLGWEFGSNNYKYTSENNLSDIEFAKELSLFAEEVSPLIGNPSVFAFPYGYHDRTEKIKETMLTDNGYKIFFINDNVSNIKKESDMVFISRVPVDGSALRENQESLSIFFDCSKIYDHENRTVEFQADQTIR